MAQVYPVPTVDEAYYEADFGVGPQVPILARMGIAITGQVRSGSSRRVEIRRQESDLERLAFIARERRVPGDETSARLLHLRLALGYQNDERWADLHPAVRRTPRLRSPLETG
ncbi:MAG: hypothetical protein RML46_05320 [Anaerolineae bacterium]|nr:hypothetical protein [Anaerolineae bacterium]MDW8068314.1 hypothetical protein [Anaerolineae bacterium]